MHNMSDSSDTPVSTEAYCNGLPIAPENYGRCFTCGLLQRSVPGVGYQEINWYSRWGVLPSLSPTKGSESWSVQPTAACLLDFRDLPNEIGIELETAHGDLEEAARVVFRKDRKCPKWQPYQPVKSLQQYHLEVSMQRLEELRQQQARDLALEQRQLDERLAKRDEEIQLTLAERDERLQVQRDIEQGRNTRLITRITVIGILIALAQVFTLTKDSLLWKLVAKIYYWLCGC